MTITELESKLAHAFTVWDRKNSKRKGYNVYALAQYLTRVDEVVTDIRQGADVRAAITAGFCGRGLDVALKAAGLPKSTDTEQRGGIGGYRPVTLETKRCD